MGLFDWFRHKDDRNIEYAKALTVQERQINHGTEQIEYQQLLGVKDKIIHDEGADAIYDSEIFFSGVSQDSEGNNVVTATGSDYAGQARRLFLSSKLGLGNIDAKTAKLQILYMEREFRNMQMMAKDYMYQLGIGSRYIAQQLHVTQNIMGSIEGKQQRNLLLTGASITRVEAGEIPKRRSSAIL